MDDRTCLHITLSQKAVLEAAGWTTLSTGHETEAACIADCERPDWYCVDAIDFVYNPPSCPCPIQPESWIFSPGGYWWPTTQVIRSLGCNQWASQVIPLGDPAFMPCGPEHHFSWILSYRIFDTTFTLKLIGVSGNTNAGSLSVISKLWTCSLAEWNCLGPNTLVGGGPIETAYCFGTGFSDSITIYPG